MQVNVNFHETNYKQLTETEKKLYFKVFLHFFRRLVLIY